MRFYSFVANLYLSPLQHGLQTAHCVSEMHAEHSGHGTHAMFDQWAYHHKTIIICAAVNSAGVLATHERLKYFQEKLGLPSVIFFEDEQSLNRAPTACAIIVPERYYMVDPVKPKRKTFMQRLFKKKTSSAAFVYHDIDIGGSITYDAGSVEAEFITFLKSYRLA